MEVAPTDAGRRALAQADVPVPTSVYELPAVRAELDAFLAVCVPRLGTARERAFKANLAYLLDLVVADALGGFDGPAVSTPARP